jgi:hypothetical protein
MKYTGPMLLQKESKNSASRFVILFKDRLSAITLAPIGKPHKKPIIII